MRPTKPAAGSFESVSSEEREDDGVRTEEYAAGLDDNVDENAIGVPPPNTKRARRIALCIAQAIDRGYLPKDIHKMMRRWMWGDSWRAYIPLAVAAGAMMNQKVDLKTNIHIMRGTREPVDYVPPGWACLEFNPDTMDSFFSCYLPTVTQSCDIKMEPTIPDNPQNREAYELMQKQYRELGHEVPKWRLSNTPPQIDPELPHRNLSL